jgi:hypothetical protein
MKGHDACLYDDDEGHFIGGLLPMAFSLKKLLTFVRGKLQ